MSALADALIWISGFLIGWAFVLMILGAELEPRDDEEDEG